MGTVQFPVTVATFAGFCKGSVETGSGVLVAVLPSAGVLLLGIINGPTQVFGAGRDSGSELRGIDMNLELIR